jgi:hypothetical protein
LCRNIYGPGGLAALRTHTFCKSALLSIHLARFLWEEIFARNNILQQRKGAGEGRKTKPGAPENKPQHGIRSGARNTISEAYINTEKNIHKALFPHFIVILVKCSACMTGA